MLCVDFYQNKQKQELFIRFTARAFRKLLSIYVFSYFPFGFEGRLWHLIVSVPDHCFSFYCILNDRSNVVVLMLLDYAMFYFLLTGPRAFSCILWFVTSF